MPELRNYLGGKPLQHGNSEQIAILKDATLPFEVHVHGRWEEQCLRCGNYFKIKKYDIENEDGWSSHLTVMTPRIYFCSRCGQRLFLFMGPESDRDLNDLFWYLKPSEWHSSKRQLWGRFLGAHEVIDELRYRSEMDSIKFYFKLRRYGESEF